MIEMIIAMTMAMLLVTLMLMLDKQTKKHNNNMAQKEKHNNMAQNMKKHNNMAQKEALMRGRGRRCFYVPRPFHAP